MRRKPSGTQPQRFCLLLLVLGALMVSAPNHAWAQTRHNRLQGGLTLRSRAPLFDHRLSYPTGRNALLRRAGWEAALALSHVNTWAQMPSYFFDGEWSRLEVRLAYGLSARSELALHGGVLRQSGGVMDGFIEGFHTLMHVTQSRRDRYPRNALRVSTLNNGSEHNHLNDAHAGAMVLSPVVVLRHALGPRALPQLLTGEVHLQLPLWPNPSAMRPKAPLLLVALSSNQHLVGPMALFAAAGLTFNALPGKLYGMPIAALGKFVVVGLNLQVAATVAVALHYLGQDGMVDSANFWPMHLSTNEFVLGAKWLPRWGRGWLFELGIIENSIHDANTPDFGVTLAMGFATG